MKITTSYVRSLEPTGERYTRVKDNLEATVSRQGKISLKFRYYRGKLERVKVADLVSNRITKDQAYDLNEIYQDIVRRHHQSGGDVKGVVTKGLARREEIRRGRPTIAKAAEEYLSWFSAEKRTGNSETSYFKNWIVPLIGHLDPREVTHSDLQHVINSVGRGNVRRTTRRHVGKVLTRFWRWMKNNQDGNGQPYVLSREVSLDLDRPKERKSKRLFTDEELRDYTTGCHNAIIACAYCPMRASELLSLNWDQFEGTREEGGWHNVRVKSDEDEDHIVRFFLTPQFMRYVETDEGLFWRGRWGKGPLKQNSLSEQFRMHRKDLGIGEDGDGVHKFRKSLATWAQSQKIPEREWRMCLGHSIPGLTGVYGLHQYLDEKREIWERWAKHLDEIRGVS